VGGRKVKLNQVLWIFLCLCPAFSGAGQQDVPPVPDGDAEGPINVLAAEVKALGLGDGAFVIGSHLTAEQIEQALANPLDDAYRGTIKFSSGDAVVVADSTSHLVLAVYQRREDARAEDVKKMVGHLMNRFGEPTTMAHGQLLYWAFDKSGKIEGDTYAEAKSDGAIDILATVKFNSTLAVNPGMDNENTEETGTIYYIITSDRLLNRFITGP
jgi:hypothetical protein